MNTVEDMEQIRALLEKANPNLPPSIIDAAVVAIGDTPQYVAGGKYVRVVVKGRVLLLRTEPLKPRRPKKTD